MNRAAVDDLYDYNRDGLVNGTDQIVARSHQTNPLTMLRLITAPAADAVLKQASDPLHWTQSSRRLSTFTSERNVGSSLALRVDAKQRQTHNRREDRRRPPPSTNCWRASGEVEWPWATASQKQ